MVSPVEIGVCRQAEPETNQDRKNLSKKKKKEKSQPSHPTWLLIDALPWKRMTGMTSNRQGSWFHFAKKRIKE